jgi:hypothetical protein
LKAASGRGLGMISGLSFLVVFNRFRRWLTGVFLDITVAFLDLRGGAFPRLAFELIRFLTAFGILTHLEPPLSGCLGFAFRKAKNYPLLFYLKQVFRHFVPCGQRLFIDAVVDEVALFFRHNDVCVPQHTKVL